MIKGQDMDPAELFMNVIAAQQDFIVNQLEKSEKRWEAEFKVINNNQIKISDELKALNNTVKDNQSVPKELMKEALDVITAKTESMCQSIIQKQQRNGQNTQNYSLN